MDLESRPLRCFVAVAEEHSFTKAAERLHVTQPTLSMQIRELEKHLGFALFIRTTRHIELTREGNAFLDDARRMIEESERIKGAVKNLRLESARRLSLGAAFYTIDIPERIDLIERFMGAHPEISLDIDNRWQRELVEDVTRGRLDLALIIGVPIPRGDYDAAVPVKRDNSEVLYPDDLKQIVLRREPVGLLVPSEWPLAKQRVVKPADIKGLKIAMLAPAHGAQIYDPIADLLQDAGAELVIPPEGNGIGVERYGRQFRIPAVTLGWFAEHNTGAADMVRLPLKGLDLTTALVLLGAAEGMRAPAEVFCDFAKGKKTAKNGAPGSISSLRG